MTLVASTPLSAACASSAIPAPLRWATPASVVAAVAIHILQRLFFASSAQASLEAFGAGDLLGIVAIILACGRAAVVAPTGVDLLVALLSLPLAFVPGYPAGVIALTLLGAWLALRRGTPLVWLGWLCLGFAWVSHWSAQVLNLVAPVLLPIEAFLAYLATLPFTSLALQGVKLWRPDGTGVFIVEACSAFTNVSIAAFLWMSLVAIQGEGIRAWHWRALRLGLSTVVAPDTVRIAAMAMSHDAYQALHFAPGSRIVAFAMLAAVIGFFTLGMRAGSSAARR